MRCFLLNPQEVVIHAFDAADIPEARQEMVRRSRLDGVAYALAMIIRRTRVELPTMTPIVTDEAP